MKTFERNLELLERGLLVFLFLVMLLLSFLQVILREFFSTGFLWADIFLRHLVLWVGFLGGALAVSSSKHFVIDIVKKYLPEKLRRATEIVITLFAAAICVHLSLAAIKFLKDDIQYPSILFSIGNFAVPSFWLNLILPLGFVLLFVHFVLKLISTLTQIFSPRSTQLAGRQGRGNSFSPSPLAGNKGVVPAEAGSTGEGKKV